jgi:hypothetical protein
LAAVPLPPASPCGDTDGFIEESRSPGRRVWLARFGSLALGLEIGLGEERDLARDEEHERRRQKRALDEWILVICDRRCGYRRAPWSRASPTQSRCRGGAPRDRFNARLGQGPMIRRGRVPR